MAPTSQSAATEEKKAVLFCRRLANQLVGTRISFQEYAYNLTLSIIYAPDECMEQCLASIPAEVGRQYMDFLRTFLEPLDFMPCPKPFLVDTGSEEIVEQKKRELRPKYIRLFELIREKVA